MTSASAQLWDQFAYDVMPWIGLPQFPDRLRSVCPDLPSERIDFWVKRFNTANMHSGQAVDPEDVGWTNEEADGIWYDRMKAIALDCIQEAADLGL